MSEGFQYRILSARSFDTLQSEVNTAITLGWEPFGGCTFAWRQDGVMIAAQTMFKMPTVEDLHARTPFGISEHHKKSLTTDEAAALASIVAEGGH